MAMFQAVYVNEDQKEIYIADTEDLEDAVAESKQALKIYFRRLQNTDSPARDIHTGMPVEGTKGGAEPITKTSNGEEYK